MKKATEEGCSLSVVRNRCSLLVVRCWCAIADSLQNRIVLALKADQRSTINGQLLINPMLQKMRHFHYHIVVFCKIFFLLRVNTYAVKHIVVQG
jgi:hypothetical protein